MEEAEERVSIEISVAENVYVSIKVSDEKYEKVLKDARAIAGELKEHLCSICQEKGKIEGKLYG